MVHGFSLLFFTVIHAFFVMLLTHSSQKWTDSVPCIQLHVSIRDQGLRLLSWGWDHFLHHGHMFSQSICLRCHSLPGACMFCCFVWCDFIALGTPEDLDLLVIRTFGSRCARIGGHGLRFFGLHGFQFFITSSHTMSICKTLQHSVIHGARIMETLNGLLAFAEPHQV